MNKVPNKTKIHKNILRKIVKIKEWLHFPCVVMKVMKQNGRMCENDNSNLKKYDVA